MVLCVRFCLSVNLCLTLALPRIFFFFNLPYLSCSVMVSLSVTVSLYLCTLVLDSTLFLCGSPDGSRTLQFRFTKFKTPDQGPNPVSLSFFSLRFCSCSCIYLIVFCHQCLSSFIWLIFLNCFCLCLLSLVFLNVTTLYVLSLGVFLCVCWPSLFDLNCVNITFMNSQISCPNIPQKQIEKNPNQA